MTFKVAHETDSSPFSIGKHHHNLYEIIFVMQGEAEFNIKGKKYLASENSMVIINHFESHQVIVNRFPYERYYMLFSQDFLNAFVLDPVLQSLLKQRPQAFQHVIPFDGSSGDLTYLTKAIYDEFSDGRDFSRQAIGSYLNLILVYLYRHHRDCFPVSPSMNNFELVSQVQNYLEAHFSQEITLKDTAAAFHVNMYYLSHVFKEVAGFTFKDYLILLRLSRAKELLGNTSRSITEVCNLAGFNNVNHFIRLFKAKTGSSPLQFRKSMTRAEQGQYA